MKDRFVGTNEKFKTFQNTELEFLEDDVNQYLEENDCRIVSHSLTSVCIADADDGTKTTIYTASIYVEKRAK